VIEAALRDRGGEPAPQQNITVTKVRQKRKAREINRHVRIGRQPRRSSDLHAPVRHDDRRRPAPRAVPRHPRHQGENNRVSTEGPWRDVKNSVEQGATFSDSLKPHPKIFDDLFVNLVAAGEIGGILDTILERLATYIEKAVKLKAQVKGALVYPIGILVVAIGVIVGAAHVGHPDVREDVRDFGGAPSCRRPPSSSSTSRTASAPSAGTSSVGRVPLIFFGMAACYGAPRRAS
jgi:hypothetical protein